MAPFDAVEALRSYYPDAAQERVHLAPRDIGLRSIGHFGFFRREMPIEQWDGIARWLTRFAPAAVAARNRI